MVARTVGELRTALPESDDLLAGLLRAAEATRTALEVDGAGLTLVHEDGPPRWVAATDTAMELLQQVQHDAGEGPYLQAYAQDRAVAVQDLRAAPAWARLDAVVGQLHVRGVLSVPVRLGDQPVGTLDVYGTQPRAWTAHELEAMGEFAAVAAELVHTGVELASRTLEVAQLKEAMTSRIWIEQAKGVLAATQGSDPEQAFQQLRARARASSRKLADLAREVVQDAQRQRWPPWRSTTPGSGRPRPAPRPPSRPCGPPRPTWPGAGPTSTRPRSPPPSASAAPTSANGPPTTVTASPTSATAWPASATKPPTGRTDGPRVPPGPPRVRAQALPGPSASARIGGAASAW
jgi:ANTAR domain/GAF domain